MQPNKPPINSPNVFARGRLTDLDFSGKVVSWQHRHRLKRISRPRCAMPYASRTDLWRSLCLPRPVRVILKVKGLPRCSGSNPISTANPRLRANDPNVVEGLALANGGHDQGAVVGRTGQAACRQESTNRSLKRRVNGAGCPRVARAACPLALINPSITVQNQATGSALISEDYSEVCFHSWPASRSSETTVSFGMRF
jgi:hypothetical protein